MEHEGDSDTNCNWHASNSLQKLSKGVRRDGNWRLNQDLPSIVKISQNTE